MRTFTVLTCVLVTLSTGLFSTGCNNYRNLRRTAQGIVHVSNLPPDAAPSLTPPPPIAWALDVQNAKGSTRITVDPTVSHPLIEVNVPELGDRTDPATWVAADAVVDGENHLLRISAAPPETLGYSMYLSITLPASNGVKVRSAGGAVEATNVAGPIDIESGGGLGVGSPITLKTRAALAQGVRAVTSAGDVRIYCGKSSSGILNVQGTTVSVTPAPGSVIRDAKQGAREFTAHAGESEAAFEVRTQQGAVDVRLTN